MDEDTKLIAPVTGYKSPQQLEVFLTLFKDQEYKNIKSQEQFNAYYEAFKPKFGTTAKTQTKSKK